jgi:DNA polymerase-3 subunit epsilon
MYAIVDIETTGGRPRRDRITEIGIVLHNGKTILDTYETLINPECYIPAGITNLTGITQEMVADAPLFHEVARQIVELTQGAVFVAHNARFDYGFLRHEFSRLGYTFSRRQLCTVRLCRKVFPGLKSYSLENLIRTFEIPVDARHRALADARATAVLLERALAKEESKEDVKLLVNMGIKETRLPQGIKLSQIENLPEACGVYYFHDSDGQVVYVGKSINIRKRIADHFADQTHKGREIQRQVADISYEETGSELIALLLESEEIKRLNPRINRAQRSRKFPWAVHAYTNDRGYLCFDVIRNNQANRDKYDLVSEFPSLSRAKGRLDHVRQRFELCSSFTNLFPSKTACFHYHLKQCRGACAGQESVADYNERAEEARELIKTIFDQDFYLLVPGRRPDEQAVVLVEEGRYRGFGYVAAEAAGAVQDLRTAIRPTRGWPDTNRIIQRYLSDHPKAKCLSLDGKRRVRF